MDIKEQLISAFNPKEKVLVAMSGGVDSSMVAWAAKKAGCEVTGVTLRLYDTDVPFWKDAEEVAKYLGIKWHLADYRKYFNEDVISPYIATYKRGETPNPCCVCNKIGKTKYLVDEMKEAGALKVASGHYARVIEDGGRKYIAKAKSQEKDQSYYLSLMEPYFIDFMLYPLGDIDSKDELRILAEELGLPVAKKKDSYEACFLMGEDYRKFIFGKIGTGMKGDFTFHNKRLAPHKGTFNYTIGQRRGLEISHTEPLYVKNINIKTGSVELAEKKFLFQKGVRLRECFFPEEHPVIFRATAKLRHKMPDAPCLVEIQYGSRAVLLFDNAQFAPAPGQITAIYEGDKVIGGGVIDSYF